MQTVVPYWRTRLFTQQSKYLWAPLGDARRVAHHLSNVAAALGVLARRASGYTGASLPLMLACRTVIFCKAPLAGVAKTRLAPVLGPGGAESLARRMFRHTVANALAAKTGPVELCVAPDAVHPVWSSLAVPAEVHWSAQGAGDLGERMARAAQRTLAHGEAALLIGTDCPALSAAVLQQACVALRDFDACIVPAKDGGYVLLGLTKFAANLFTDMPWSTAEVASLTIKRIAQLQWTLAVLPTLHDIDEPQDLRHLPAAWLQQMHLNDATKPAA